MVEFNQRHLDKFRQLAAREKPPAWTGGHNLQKFAKYIEYDGLIDFPDSRVSREWLKMQCQSKSWDDEACLVACMAWGGMRWSHSRKAWAGRSQWGQTIQIIRSGAVDRSTAYQLFQDLRNEGLLPNIGPAYFTKLIFFLRKNNDGYIMDQWTAKSVQLLTGKPTPRILSGYVSPKNTSQDYEAFCKIIDELASITSEDGTILEGHEVEERLFSGGRPRHQWRQYVVDQWKSNHKFA